MLTTLTYQDKKVPNRLTVIGSRDISAWIGQCLHNLGLEVTLIQKNEERSIKGYDLKISEAITKALTEQEINLVTGAAYSKVEADGALKVQKCLG